MPLPLVTCRCCGRTIPAGTMYCVACATGNADRDAAIFDRWLTISFRGSVAIMILLAGYLTAKYFSLLA